MFVMLPWPTKRFRFILLLALLVATAASGQNPAPELPSSWTPKKPVVNKRDMVAAANPLAIDLPNVGSRNGPTEVEKGTSAVALEPKLEALGHEIEVMDHISGLHTIVRTRTGWIGGVDPRREGTAKGD